MESSCEYIMSMILQLLKDLPHSDSLTQVLGNHVRKERVFAANEPCSQPNCPSCVTDPCKVNAEVPTLLCWGAKEQERDVNECCMAIPLFSTN